MNLFKEILENNDTTKLTRAPPYQEAVIDFDKTSAGIFGILGIQFSKSAMEAISTFVEVKAPSKGKRAYNMLNLRSDKCELDFEF